ncbi:MAG TPA: glycosyltransferase family 2 protein [Longimicrobiaceae bacterium]|nr:glycosyltransferase family 2 protein [Longimicrobiaceae bacterium]
MSPRVLAVVLNWCAEEDTAACLRSLAASDFAGLEVLLVDNASPDGSGERLHQAFPALPYLQTGANLGYTGGNNRGIERALQQGYDYVLVLNNDTVVEPGCVSRLVETAERNGAACAVGAKILVHDAPERVWFGGGRISRSRAVATHRLQGGLDPDPEGGPTEEVTFLTGCCMLIPAAVLRRVGGFEEDFFMYIEDVDLSLRIAAAGYRLLYEPRARVLHRVSLQDAGPSPFQIFLRDRNRRRLARRRYGWADRLRFALVFYPGRVVRMLQYLARRDGARAGAIWRALIER